MKTIICILILSLFCNSRYHIIQEDAERAEIKDFISTVVKYERNEEIFLVDEAGISEFKGCWDWLCRDTSLVSKKDQAELLRKIEGGKTYKWDSKLAPNVHLIRKDTLEKIYSLYKINWWDYFEKNYGSNLYTLSYPLFFKNNTMCFFYQDKVCGELCGEGKIILYKKEKGGWKVFKQFCIWVS